MQNQNIQYLKSRIEKLESLKGLKLNYIDGFSIPSPFRWLCSAFSNKRGNINESS